MLAFHLEINAIKEQLGLLQEQIHVLRLTTSMDTKSIYNLQRSVAHIEEVLGMVPQNEPNVMALRLRELQQDVLSSIDTFS